MPVVKSLEQGRILPVPKEYKSLASKSTSNEASSADDLKKYKDLLDTGVISQEEFDAKKKQILGV